MKKLRKTILTLLFLICVFVTYAYGSGFWGIGVDSFKGRTGVVIPQVGDYLYSQLSTTGPIALKSGGIAVGGTYYLTDPGTGNAIFEGKVGIGTSTPGTFALNVNGTVNTGAITSGGVSSFVGGNMFFDANTSASLGTSPTITSGPFSILRMANGNGMLFTTSANYTTKYLAFGSDGKLYHKGGTASFFQDVAINMNALSPGGNNRLEVKDGHIANTMTTAPTTTLCGNNPTPVGTDMDGTITVTGVGVTTCTMTFNLAWNNAYGCSVHPGSAATAAAAIYSSSTTTLYTTFGMTAVTNPVLIYHCAGN